MIVFLTDGKATNGVRSSVAIKENIRKANAESQIPIYGLAFGKDADFDLVKDISDESNGFAERISESGSGLEQNMSHNVELRSVFFWVGELS